MQICSRLCNQDESLALTGLHYTGAVLVFSLITIVGLYSGKKVKNASDFNSGSGKSGAGVVVGAIVGTVVGGASTIGTAQLAFYYGLSAWWFTLGSGLGFVVMLLFFCGPIYKNGIVTLPQIFSKEYGEKAGITATVLNSVGSFLSVVVQILSGVALISAVSHIGPVAAMAIMVVLIFVYVVFGGIWGTGYVGIAKTILIYAATGLCGILALVLQGGPGVFMYSLPTERYFNLFARGFVLDGGAALSLVLGTLTTQIYIQTLLMARTLEAAKKGVLISAIILPLAGVGGILVGFYMKLNYPEIIPGAALPLFILLKTPPLLAGITLAALLVALVGTGAGMILGISTMITNNIYKAYFGKKASGTKELFVNRLCIVLILVIAAVFSAGNIGTLILGWSFLSMGLRGVVGFGPLCTALFLPGRIRPVYVQISMILGITLVILGRYILPPYVDSLFLGVAGSLLVLAIGLTVDHK